MRKRLLAFLLCLVMALSLLPVTAAFALDTNKIYEVTAAGIKQPVFGETADFSTTLTVPDGAHYTARLAEAPVSPGGSYARNDVTYTYKVVYTPAAGYSFPSTSQIDATLSGVARDTYSVEKGIATDGKLTVWYYFDFGFLHYTLNQFKYAIPESRVGLAIDPIALPTDTGTIKGGTAPYTFEKVNKPDYATLDWVKVSSNGIITGTPTRAADRTSFGVWVKITDATGKSCIFTVEAGRTINTLDADKIYEVTAAGIKQPVFGEKADFSTTLTVPAGAHYTANLAEYPVSPGGSYARNDVTYTYKVVYTPAAGYSFPSTSQIDATLSGVARGTYSVEKGIASDGKLTVWYYFDFGFLHYTLNQFKYAIPESRVGLAIDPIALPTDTGTIKGGTAPYTFEKVNKPDYATLDWVEVSSNGIITGTPTRAEASKTYGVWVRITDATGKSCIFTVEAGRTIESPYPVGDIDGNYVVNATDLTALLRHVAKIELLTGTKLDRANVDGKGGIDAADVTALARKLGG